MRRLKQILFALFFCWGTLSLALNTPIARKLLQKQIEKRIPGFSISRISTLPPFFFSMEGKLSNRDYQMDWTPLTQEANLFLDQLKVHLKAQINLLQKELPFKLYIADSQIIGTGIFNWKNGIDLLFTCSNEEQEIGRTHVQIDRYGNILIGEGFAAHRLLQGRWQASGNLQKGNFFSNFDLNDTPITGSFSFDLLFDHTHFTSHFHGKKLKIPSFYCDEIVSELNGEYSSDLKLLTINSWNGTVEALPFEIKGSLSHSNKQIKALFSLIQAPIEVVKLLYPELALSGSTSGELFIEGPLDNLQGHAKINLEELLFDHPDLKKEMVPLNGTIQTDFSSTSLNFSTEVFCNTKQLINFSGSLPIQFHSSTLSLQNHLPFNTHLKAQGRLLPFIAAAATEPCVIDGYLDIDLDIKGTLLHPLCDGYTKIIQGKYESKMFGTQFNTIDIDLQAIGNTLQTRKLLISTPNNGSIKGDLKLELSKNNQFPIELTLAMKRVTLINLDQIQTTLSGNLKLKGPLTHPALTGDLLANQTDFTILKKRSKRSIATVPFHLFPPTNKPIKTKKTSHFLKLLKEIDLDIRLAIPKKAFIRGYGLTTDWSGELFIKGSNKHLQIFGELQAKRGRFLFAQKKFDLIDGKLSFNGELKNIYLDTTFLRETEELNTHILLKGPIKSPVFTLSSTPEKPLKEVLSHVLFNKDLQDISPLQGVQLARAILSLTQEESSIDFIDQMRKKIGLDLFDITTSKKIHSIENEENGELKEIAKDEISLRAGKYLGEKVFISLDRNLTTEVSKLGIEIALPKRLKLKAETGDDSETKVELKWRKDY